ncbi:Peptidase M24, structural domain protein [Cordyceps fumosorosea ARSEF 2679]|uniref:Peptidase M24, structural domain protein n=1 Tax=Cordyceps fumosorosea (strain ARSEF 2679) TaxID=1081104 RepID=A0A162MSB8_CORFA|nr:Peptidase M24, structural domain protein [Cordyceps fumosorosea ARSEF 2679]OAA69489.1 Peptidase M24, structural domain protein [Cordyceps fumosorosea ARSEF 2679]
MSTAEAARIANLREAQNKAIAMFKEIEETLIRPGVSDKTLSAEIAALGKERHALETHWHKRIVRSGPNTLAAYKDNPPDRVIEEDDIVVVDLGPVFERWEADFGRTFVLGGDPRKLAVRDALEPTWLAVRDRWRARPGMTGAELFAIAKEAGEAQGRWTWGADIAGHIVGSFPHERIPQDMMPLYIAAGNTTSMRTVGKDGHMRQWILEIYLHDKEGQFGGFFEQLLTVDDD